MRFRALLIAVAATASGVVAARAPLTVDAIRGNAFGVGRGFGSAVAASVRKLPNSRAAPVQQVVIFHGVMVSVQRWHKQVLPLEVWAPSPAAVRIISKELAEMPRSAVDDSLGKPDSESADILTYLGPAEICVEHLDLKYRDNQLVSAKWRFCFD